MKEILTNGASPKTTASGLSERVRSLRLPDPAEAPGSAWWWLPWVLCLLLACVCGILALEAFSPIDDDQFKKMAEERGLKSLASPTSSTISIPGGPASSSSATEIALESKGYIVPISLIQVSPIISGTVMSLNFEEGMAVSPGFVLAALDKTEFQAEFDRTTSAVKSAQARHRELSDYLKEEIQQAKADLDDAIAQRDQANAKFARTKRLREMNAASPEDYELAQSGAISSEARQRRAQLTYQLLSQDGPRKEKIAAALADVNQAQADLDKAKWRLDNTEVRAPIKGIILSKKTEQGNIVNPSAFSNGLSASLCEMADLHKMEVDLSIAERDIAKVFKDQQCRLRSEAFPKRIYTGYVSRIMPMADRGKGAVPVRVRINFDVPAVDDKGVAQGLDKQGEYLRPEMGAIVTFLNRKK